MVQFQVSKIKWCNDKKDFSAKLVRNQSSKVRSNYPLELEFPLKLLSPPKINYFLWRAHLDCIASKEALSWRGVHIPNLLCCNCGMKVEIANHLLSTRSFTKDIRDDVLALVKLPSLWSFSSFKETMVLIDNSTGSKDWKKLIFTITFAACSNTIPLNIMIGSIKAEAFFWIVYRSKLMGVLCIFK